MNLICFAKETCISHFNTLEAKATSDRMTPVVCHSRFFHNKKTRCFGYQSLEMASRIFFYRTIREDEWGTPSICSCMTIFFQFTLHFFPPCNIFLTLERSEDLGSPNTSSIHLGPSRIEVASCHDCCKRSIEPQQGSTIF